ncbi:MAG: hypothetical protein NZ703_14030, partial [Gemmataceae bacterium]|nr:hypothetical protein [Gemmataceae bacterium]
MASDAALRDLALRYAAGALSDAELAAFEARLASDPQAREAVAEAVRLSAAVLQCAPPAPDPSYRQAAYERILHPHRPWWLSRRAYYGHPLLWTALGGTCVAALALLAGRQLPTPAPETANRSSSVSPSPLPTTKEQPAPPTASLSSEAFAATTSDVAPIGSDAPVVPHPFPTAPTEETLPLASSTPGRPEPSATAEQTPAPSVAELWADWSTPERIEKVCDEERRFRQKIRDMT